jgi:hypothetical protein
MVVPSSGQRTYSVPLKANGVTLHAPSGSKVEINLAASALTPHSRAFLEVLGAGRKESFTAEDDGSATVQIAAKAGDRLALTIDAISLAGDSSVVIWRPQFKFVDRGLRLDFRFYKYIDNWCDADGDGHITLEISADTTQAFKIGARVTESDFDAPWWAYVIAWVGGEFLLGVIGFVVAEILVETVVKDAIRDKVNAPSKVDLLLGSLNDQLKAPTVPHCALFLDDVIATSDGLVLAGHADAGQIVAYGRGAGFSSGDGYIIASPSLSTDLPSRYIRLDWQPSFGTIRPKPRTGFNSISEHPAETYWGWTMDDLPAAPFVNNLPALDAGGSVMMLIDDGDAIVKLLLERSPHTDVPSVGGIVTWIAFQKRVEQALRLANNVVAKKLSSNESMLLIRETFSYRGTVSLEPVRLFSRRIRLRRETSTGSGMTRRSPTRGFQCSVAS